MDWSSTDFDAIQNLAWQPGKEFVIVSVSIDPTETDNLAARVKQEYVENGSWSAAKGSEQHADHGKLTRMVLSDRKTSGY